MWGGKSCSSNPRGPHSAWWASVGLGDEQFEMAIISFLLILLWSYHNNYSFFFCSWSLLTLLVCGIHKTHFELVASSFLVIINLAYTIKVMLDFYTWHSNITSEITDFEVWEVEEGRGLEQQCLVWGASCVTPDTQFLSTSGFPGKAKVVHFEWNPPIFQIS